MLIAKQSSLLGSPKALLEVTKHLDIAPRRKILRTVSTPSFVVQDELDKARRAWKEYRSTRRRDAIYKYLSAVFEVVRRWKEQHCIDTKVRQALRSTGRINAIRSREPFAIIIFCTSDFRAVDTKTRSKWSRLLQVVDKNLNPRVESLTRFIKSRGGINNVLLAT